MITADVAAALSLSVTHKAVGFDRRMPDVDFDALDLPVTATLPIARNTPVRLDQTRQRQQPRHPGTARNNSTDRPQPGMTAISLRVCTSTRMRSPAGS